MYINKTKRNLIIASAVINLISVTVNLILSIVMSVKGAKFQNSEFMFILSFFYENLVSSVLSFALGIVASLLLLRSIRQKGKYFRASYSLYVAGLIIIIIFGSFLSWLLLFISMFVPDVVVMNDRSEMRQEERMKAREEVLETKEMEEKKRRIEQLKAMRDAGIISEEEYKQQLFELL